MAKTDNISAFKSAKKALNLAQSSETSERYLNEIIELVNKIRSQ